MSIQSTNITISSSAILFFTGLVMTPVIFTQTLDLYGGDAMEMSPQEVAEALSSSESIQLIDVRGPDEHELASIKGAKLLTQELSDEIVTSWDKDAAIILYCHHGVRSLNAAKFLNQKGFTNVRSMTGGIDAWSTEVDSDVPRY